MKRYRNINIHSDLVDSLEPPEPVVEMEEAPVEENAAENEVESGEMSNVAMAVQDADITLSFDEE